MPRALAIHKDAVNRVDDGAVAPSMGRRVSGLGGRRGPLSFHMHGVVPPVSPIVSNDAW